jgi:putative ABC transport system ATP-binding protein
MSGAVRLTDVVVQYQTGSDRLRALRSVNLDVAPGEYVTIVGANGAGKSTLANVIAGAVLPSSGRVAIAGRDVTRKRDYQRAASVSRVFQDVNDGACATLTVAENMLLAHLRAHRRSPIRLAANRRRRALLREELAALRVGLENKMDVPAGALSGGQRQLVSLLMAVTGQPQVLLLDEHTSALDPEMAHIVIERTDSVIRERGLTALMITHNMAHAAHYGDRVLIMMRGQVAADIQDGERARLDADGLIQRFRALAADAVTDTLLGA